jgi:hypothetical protein
MSGYRFALTCPYDGAPLRHTADGISDGFQTNAVARCTECSAELIVNVRIVCTNADKRATPAKRAALERSRARLAERKVNA